MTTKSWQYVHQ